MSSLAKFRLLPASISQEWPNDLKAALIDALLDRYLAETDFEPAEPRPVPLLQRIKWPVPSNPTQKAPHCHKLKQSKPRLHCGLCEKNGEPPSIYSNHVLKDQRGIVVCPILRKLACSLCGYPGGDYSHTERYCPKNKNPLIGKATVRQLKELPNSMGKMKCRRG